MPPDIEPKPAASFCRYDYLDGFRAVMALYVVAHHAFSMPYYYNGASLNRLFKILAFGHFAVAFFVILSGFCLALPILKTDFRLAAGMGNFIQRRAQRIIPPYYFAIAFALVLIVFFIPAGPGSHWDSAVPVTPHSIATHLFLIQNFIPADTYRINYVFWSISLEWQIYFFFPLLLIGWRTFGPIPTTLVTFLVSLVAEDQFHRIGLSPSVNFLGLFALGMWAAQLSFSGRCPHLPFRYLAAAFFVAFCALTQMHLPGLRVQLAQECIFGCFAAALLIAVSHHPQGWLHAGLSWKPLVFVGTFSYSLYLVHAPLLQLLWQYPLAPWKDDANVMCFALLLVGLPAIVLVSYLFFLCFERPSCKKEVVKPFAPGRLKSRLPEPATLGTSGRVVECG
jgi:peptidoglycan/LPS O-acetylase OafA/YrhL